MAKIRHKITKHTTQEVTLDQNNAFKAQKHGNSETFQLRFNDKTDYPLNEIYSINKKIQSQKAIICKNISNPGSSESCLEVSTNFSEDFYFEFEINTNTSIWFTNNDIQYSLGNFELEVHYTQSGTTQFINLYYNENAVPGPISDSWLTGEFGPELSNEDLQNGVKFFTDQLSSSVSHVILKIKGAGAVSLTKITAKKYSDNAVLKNYINPYKEMSGITSNSVRKVGRNINNKSSLPNYYKETLTGIANRNITYFDTESFVFSDNSNINIVEQIPSDSKFDGYINNIVSTPNTSPEFQSQGSFKSYHLDSIIDRKIELSSIKPYNDEHSYAFQNSDFFASSSNPYNTIDNFTGLEETIAIEIDLSSEYGALLSRHDGSFPHFSNEAFIKKYKDDLTLDPTPGLMGSGSKENWNVSNRPMVFFDFENNRWEYIVSGSENFGSSVDIQNETVGFSPGTKYLTENNSKDLLIGSPTKNFGFPNDTKFTGLERNQLSLSNYLDKPFALEKVSYDFIFSARGDAGSGIGPSVYYNEFFNKSRQQNITFFILNQFNDIKQTQLEENKIKDFHNQDSQISGPREPDLLDVSISPTTVGDSINRYYAQGYPYAVTPGDLPDENINLITTEVDKKSSREIVTFNNVFLHSTQGDNSILQNVIEDASFSLDPGSLYEFENMGVIPRGEVVASVSTHKYNAKINDNVRTPLLMNDFGLLDSRWVVDNSLGDKDLRGTPSIRSNDIKSVAIKTGTAMEPVGGYATSLIYNGSIEFSSLTLDTYEKNYSNKPYILKPSDNLIFGVEFNKIDAFVPTNISPILGPPYVTKSFFYIHAGQFKVTLHGRYLKNNRLVNDNHSSNLNSKSINSSIIGNTFPQDQFIEPINVKENTYVDRIYTGDITLENTREKSGLLSSNTLGVYTGCISLNTNKVYYDSMVPNINDILNSDDNFYVTSPSLLTSREMLFSKINDIEFPQTLNYFSKNLSINSAEGLLHSVYFGPIEDNFSSFMPQGNLVNVNDSRIFKEDKTIDIYSFEDEKVNISSQMNIGVVDIISHISDIDFDIHKDPVGTYKAIVFSGGDDYHINANNNRYPGNVDAPDPQKLQQRHIKITSIIAPEFKHNTKLTLNITFKTLNAGIVVDSVDESAEVIPELAGLEGFDYDNHIDPNITFFEGRNLFNISLVGKTSGRVYNQNICSLVTNTMNVLSQATWKTNYGSVEFIDLPQEEYDVYLFQPHKGGATRDCFALSDLKIIADVSYDIAKFPIQEYFPFDNLYENLTREIFNETTSNIEYYQNKRPQTLVNYNVDFTKVTFDDMFVRKYGLLNVKPKESKVYFKDNHYGYYSDLIYTTPSGKMYNKENNLLNDYLVRINKYNNDFTLADISDNYRYGRSFKPFME